jgi:hypothetical protein
VSRIENLDTLPLEHPAVRRSHIVTAIFATRPDRGNLSDSPGSFRIFPAALFPPDFGAIH